jgi:hypothetical protein
LCLPWHLPWRAHHRASRASRIAGLSGFLTLIQSSRRSGAIGRREPPRHNPCAAVLVCVLVEHGSGRVARQQLRQLRLALPKRQRTQSGTVRCQQIESVQDRIAGLVPAVESIEDSDAIWAGDHCPRPA